MLTSSINEPVVSVNNDVNLNICSKSALLIDYNSGEVLFEKNSNVKLHPASMTKIMGLYLQF